MTPAVAGRRWSLWRRAAVRGLAALTVAGALALAASPAGAQTPGDKAASRTHFEQGERHFKEGRYADALTEYERGYVLVALPGFLINIAHCHRMLGELRKARASYRKFLLVQPVSPRRSEVEDIIAKLDRAIAEEDAEAATAPSPAAGGEADRAAEPSPAKAPPAGAGRGRSKSPAR